MMSKKLKCNLDKSKLVCFGDKSESIGFDNLSLSRKSHLKYLGVLIDEQLNFKEHINKVKSKLFCNYTILRTRRLLSKEQLLMYYKLHIKPTIQYGILVYGCTAYSSLQPIMRLQKRILRSIFFLSKFESVRDLMIHHGLTTVYELTRVRAFQIRHRLSSQWPLCTTIE